ncbi:PilZ domain-containing protein [Rhodovulum sp. ES.010]|uniref:PilZ domain-containing protein n=1 Tax=Rhodovulum sp. ES.010 TaxID=1882821 RepID=UPI0015880186|nr:PilZ domain-containing protein [Rhodovulum sp. ES.010]
MSAQLMGAAAFAQSAPASDACPLHDWLAWVYAAGESLDRSSGGPEAERAPLDLARAVMQAESTSLTRVMGAVELDQHLPTVTAYLVLLKARLIDLVDPASEPLPNRAAKRDPRHPDAIRMGAFIGELACEADPDWTARPPKAETESELPEDARQDSVRDALLATGAALGAATTAAAIVALGAGLFTLLDRRRNIRHPCRMKTDLHTTCGQHAGVAVDISRKGAKLRVGEEIADHTRCVFEVGGLALPARVLWSNSHFAGISFFTPMEQATFEQLLRRHQWDAPAFAYPMQGHTQPNVPLADAL